MELQTIQANIMTVSEIISINIPRTNDRGDALCADRAIPFTMIMFGASIKAKLATQHLNWMKGDN